MSESELYDQVESLRSALRDLLDVALQLPALQPGSWEAEAVDRALELLKDDE